MSKVWIVGKHNGPDKPWEFQGVFDSEARAEAACLDWNWFYGPATMNEALSANATAWPGCTYPRHTVADRIDVTNLDQIRDLRERVQQSLASLGTKGPSRAGRSK